MELHGTTWNKIELHGTTWNYIEPHGTIWYYMELHGTTWNYMELHKTTWNYMELHEQCGKLNQYKGPETNSKDIETLSIDRNRAATQVRIIPTTWI